MQHLRDRQYYIDLYNKFTIERCYSIESIHDNLEDVVIEEIEKLSEDEISRTRNAADDLAKLMEKNK